MAKPQNVIIRLVQKNDPRRFHTRVRGESKRPDPEPCTCGKGYSKCQCDEPDPPESA